MKWFKLIAIILIIGSLAGSAALYTDYRAFLETPLAVPEKGKRLNVISGSSISSIGRQLEKEGVLRSSLYLEAYARLNKLAPRIKAGEYWIEPATTPRELMEQLVAGRVIQYSLTILEGWTFQQMLRAMADHPKLTQSLQGLDDEAIMARLGHPDKHPEGRFFPDTYHFPAGTTDVEFLQRAFEAMEYQLQEAWSQRAPGLPLETPYQALILASIIEKETPLPRERPEVAGVFIRRLQRGMRLQTDPTVIYGLGEAFDGNLRRNDLRQDTPYNTYTRGGLPPTPIALPGAESLLAAVNPAPGDTLYFVATGEGGHVFSRTLREHNRAVRKYQLSEPFTK